MCSIIILTLCQYKILKNALVSSVQIKTKPKQKNERVDLFIPIGGVALVFLVGIEGTYQGIVMNLPILMEKITELASQFLGIKTATGATRPDSKPEWLSCDRDNFVSSERCNDVFHGGKQQGQGRRHPRSLPDP